MGAFRWTPQEMDRLERAARDGRRIVLFRRGTEYVVVARRVRALGRDDAVIGYLPTTGEELVFLLNDIDDFRMVGE
ncbi:MAG: hypothetical protein NW201_02990 [Gemmatimonadales bacterium]|nr:hypothetical protein [Gemmatimonadales bacterium]